MNSRLQTPKIRPSLNSHESEEHQLKYKKTHSQPTFSNLPNTYKITSKNQTGGKQDYNFFSAVPIVSRGNRGEIWSNVLKDARNTPNDGVVTFDITTTYHAICGSYEGSPTEGGRISISKSIPVDDGSDQSGSVKMGSSVHLTVFDQKTCDMEQKMPGLGKLSNFLLDTTVNDTANSFRIQDAKDNNLLIGVATSKNGGLGEALGTFMPYPNVKYQIAPQPIFYVAAGASFKVGDLVKVEMMGQTGQTQAVDFVPRQTSSVTLIHGDDNLFRFA